MPLLWMLHYHIVRKDYQKNHIVRKDRENIVTKIIIIFVPLLGNGLSLLLMDFSRLKKDREKILYYPLVWKNLYIYIYI